MVKTAQEKGYDFEADVQGHLVYLMEYHKAYFIRLYDTKSAGAYLPAQPGDFVLWARGRSLLIECKSSEKEVTMSRSYITKNIGESQSAKMAMMERAGGFCCYLFRSEAARSIEIWPAVHIREVFLTPRMKPDPLKIINSFPDDKKLLREALVSLMENPLCLR